MSDFYRQKADGILLNIKAVPNSSKNEICGLLDNSLKVKIKAPAVENKANLELIRFIAKEIGVPKTTVSLDSGGTSKLKILYIAQLSIEKFSEFCDKIGINIS